jgi:hypothetical protein
MSFLTGFLYGTWLSRVCGASEHKSVVFPAGVILTGKIFPVKITQKNTFLLFSGYLLITEKIKSKYYW